MDYSGGVLWERGGRVAVTLRLNSYIIRAGQDTYDMTGSMHNVVGRLEVSGLPIPFIRFAILVANYIYCVIPSTESRKTHVVSDPGSVISGTT